MEIFFIIVPVFIVLFIALAVYSHKKEKERRERLQGCADAFGLYYEPDKVRGFDNQHPDFNFLRRGSNRYAHNILSGEWQGRDVTVFDYHYETHSTDSKGRRTTHHHRFSAAMVRAEFRLQSMAIRPEGIFDRVKAAFGWDDIDFESAEFSKRFHVSAKDRRWAYDVLPAQTMELLLDNPSRELYFEGNILAVRSNKSLEPVEVEGLLDIASGVLNGIPQFARQA